MEKYTARIIQTTATTITKMSPIINNHDDEQVKCEWCDNKAEIALKESGNLILDAVWHRHCEWDREAEIYQAVVCRECGEGFLSDNPNHEHRPFTP